MKEIALTILFTYCLHWEMSTELWHCITLEGLIHVSYSMNGTPWSYVTQQLQRYTKALGTQSQQGKNLPMTPGF